MRSLHALAMIVLGLPAVCLAESPAQAQIADAPTAVRPLAVGARAPLVTVRRADGKSYRFDPNRLARPQVLIFYRGGWCPFCNMQLDQLRFVEPKLRERGFDVLFFSTDRPELLYSSLKHNHVDYTLLSDSRLEAAEAFHIAYHLDDAAFAKQLSYGVDLEKTTGNGKHELPVPSVFIVDKSGIIRFVYSNPDYKIRLGADALWKAAMPFATGAP